MIAIFIVGTFLIHMHERVLILPYELTVSLRLSLGATGY